MIAISSAAKAETWQQADWSEATLDSLDASSGLSLQQTEGWFDADWQYRKQLTVSPVSEGVSNYALHLTLSFETGMSEDYADLRFTDENGDLLSYWIESSSETEASVWVKADFPSVSTSTLLYLYYGNADADSLSDAASVFSFAEDFETFSGWTKHGSGNLEQSTAQAASGLASGHKITNGDPSGAVKSLGTTLGRGTVLEFWLRRNAAYTGGAADRVGLIDANGNGYGWIFNHSTGQLGIDKRTNHSAVVSGYVSASSVKDDWIFAQFIIEADGSITAKQWLDGELIAETQITDASYSSFSQVYIYGGSDYWVDDMHVRPYLATEPTVSIGAEVSKFASAGTVTSSIFDMSSSGGKLLSVDLEGELLSGVAVKIRTSNDAQMLGATAFSACNEISTLADVSGNNCLHDGDRYVQYQLSFAQVDLASPVLESITLNYEAYLLSVVARAGADATIVAGKTYQLSGANSVGRDLSYSWAIVTGDGILTDATSTTPSFSSSADTASQNVRIFLTVRDVAGTRNTDEIVLHLVGTQTGGNVSSAAAGTYQNQGIFEELGTSADGSANVLSLSIGATTLELPNNKTDYSFSINSAGKMVLGVSDDQETRGSVYLFEQALAQLSGTIRVSESARLSVTQVLAANGSFGTQKQIVQTSNGAVTEIIGNGVGDEFGRYVETGDLNGDGVDEIVVGAPGAGSYGAVYIYTSAGELLGVVLGTAENPAYSFALGHLFSATHMDLVFGSNNFAQGSSLHRSQESHVTTVDAVSIVNGNQNFSGVSSLTDEFVDVQLGAGESYRSFLVDDFNADGIDDVVLASDAGEVSLFFGAFASGTDKASGEEDVLITGFEDLASAGESLAAGDVNADGIKDLVVGEPGYQNARGAVHVFFGQFAGRDSINAQDDYSHLSLLGESDGMRFGSDVSVVDSDDDGKDEVYSVKSGSSIYKLNLDEAPSGPDGGSDSGEGEVTGFAANGGGCSLQPTAPNFNLFVIFLPLLALLGVCRKKISSL